MILSTESVQCMQNQDIKIKITVERKKNLPVNGEERMWRRLRKSFLNLFLAGSRLHIHVNLCFTSSYY